MLWQVVVIRDQNKKVGSFEVTHTFAVTLSYGTWNRNRTNRMKWNHKIHSITMLAYKTMSY